MERAKPKEENSKGTGFRIDWNKGEKYYQIHIFETVNGETAYYISSKINENGKIEAIVRRTTDSPAHITYQEPATKEEFETMLKMVIKAAEKTGFVHRFFDLSNCETPAEQLALLQKMEPRFRINIRDRSRSE